MFCGFYHISNCSYYLACASTAIEETETEMLREDSGQVCLAAVQTRLCVVVCLSVRQCVCECVLHLFGIRVWKLPKFECRKQTHRQTNSQRRQHGTLMSCTWLGHSPQTKSNEAAKLSCPLRRVESSRVSCSTSEASCAAVVKLNYYAKSTMWHALRAGGRVIGCTRCWCSRKGYNGNVSSSRPKMHLQIHFDLQLRRKLEAPQRHRVCRQEGRGSCAVSPPSHLPFPVQPLDTTWHRPLRAWTFCSALQMTNNFCSFIENVWLQLSRNLAGCICLCLCLVRVYSS